MTRPYPAPATAPAVQPSGTAWRRKKNPTPRFVIIPKTDLRCSPEAILPWKGDQCVSGTLIVGFDETEASHRPLAFAAKTAKATGATVHVVHVLEWSPYSFLTAQELEERYRRRTEELSRAAEL